MLTRLQRAGFLLPFVVIVLIFIIFPAIIGFISSFTNYSPLQQHPVHVVGLENYARVFSEPEFPASLHNITIFTIFTVSLELMLGVLLAYTLRVPFRGRSFVRVVLLLPWLVSPIANGVMWHYIFNQPGFPNLLGSSTALIVVMLVEVWRTAPFVTFLVLPGVLGIPQQNWDDARLDGLSSFAKLRFLVLPRLKTLLLSIGMLLVGQALGAFETILIFTGGGPGSATVTPGLYAYQSAIKTYDWTRGVPASWLIAFAVLVVGIIYVFVTERERTLGTKS